MGRDEKRSQPDVTYTSRPTNDIIGVLTGVFLLALGSSMVRHGEGEGWLVLVLFVPLTLYMARQGWRHWVTVKLYPYEVLYVAGGMRHRFPRALTHHILVRRKRTWAPRHTVKQYHLKLRDGRALYLDESWTATASLLAGSPAPDPIVRANVALLANELRIPIREQE